MDIKVKTDNDQERAEKIAQEVAESAKLARQLMERTAKARQASQSLNRKPSYKRF